MARDFKKETEKKGENQFLEFIRRSEKENRLWLLNNIGVESFDYFYLQTSSVNNGRIKLDLDSILQGYGFLTMLPSGDLLNFGNTGKNHLPLAILVWYDADEPTNRQNYCVLQILSVFNTL